MPRSLPHDWFPEPLPENVQIGLRSWLYSSFAFRHCHSRRTPAVSIGHDSGLYNGTFFNLGPQGEVHIGDYCSIVGAVFSTNGRVVIGDYTFMAHEVVVADESAAVPGRGVAPRQGPAETPEILIGEAVWIGMRATLLRGTRLGEGVIVGAAAVIDFEVPPFAIVAGNPARIVGWTNRGS